MTTHERETALVFLSRLVLVIVGFSLMVIGLALGVTLVLLPVGLGIGLIGALTFITGLFGWGF